MQREHYFQLGSRPEGALAELWEYRELFFFFAWRDVKVRYKQTVLGVAWALIQPLTTMVIFTVLFNRIANIPTDGLPAPLFYIAALVPWTYVSSTVNTTAMSLVSNANLLTKIYFPRMILPASATLSGLLDFLIGSLVLVGFVIYYQVPFAWSMLLWPLLVVLMGLLAFSIGVLSSALNVRYRDVKYAIPFAIQLWFFVTPIVYPASILPDQFRWLVSLNPLTGIIEGFRYVLAPSMTMHWNLLAVSAAVTAALLIVAVVFFRRTESIFADVV